MSVVLERWGHSCVRLLAQDPIVIDPGVYSDLSQALAGARQILVTHEHGDHLAVPAVVEAVAGGAEVYAPAPVVDQLVGAGAAIARVHRVQDGDRLDLAGLDVQVLGEWHAPLHPAMPRFANVGFLIDGALLHPGDAYVDLAGRPTPDTVLAPVAAPWLLLADLVDWVRELAPRQVVPVHDAPASEVGRDLWTRWVERLCDSTVTWLAPGERLLVG
ncbi:MAG: MBL fold metallo-hydrolase [Actinobacteria bacterium]|nr:MBL fold metallo-hydrolase [Actinomycetota bacterium]MCG2801708.1 MBL fold metallo-hydrolase [Cellulomonas sp.]